MAGTGRGAPIAGGLMEITIRGDSRQVDNILRGMENAFQDVNIANDFLKDWVDPILRRRTESRFGTEGDDIVGAWQELAPATVQIRQDAGFPGSHPINERTGAMKRFLLDAPPDVVAHSIGATMWSPGRGVPAGVAKKIKTAQAGGSTPDGRNVPARPVLGVGPVDLEAIMVAMAKYIEKYQAVGSTTGIEIM